MFFCIGRYIRGITSYTKKKQIYTQKTDKNKNKHCCFFLIIYNIQQARM